MTTKWGRCSSGKIFGFTNMKSGYTSDCCPDQCSAVGRQLPDIQTIQDSPTLNGVDVSYSDSLAVVYFAVSGSILTNYSNLGNSTRPYKGHVLLNAGGETFVRDYGDGSVLTLERLGDGSFTFEIAVTEGTFKVSIALDHEVYRIDSSSTEIECSFLWPLRLLALYVMPITYLDTVLPNINYTYYTPYSHTYVNTSGPATISSNLIDGYYIGILIKGEGRRAPWYWDGVPEHILISTGMGISQNAFNNIGTFDPCDNTSSYIPSGIGLLSLPLDSTSFSGNTYETDYNEMYSLGLNCCDCNDLQFYSGTPPVDGFYSRFEGL